MNITGKKNLNCSEFIRENAKNLTNKYGTPVYVYFESILRQRCREMRTLLPDLKYRADYSVKANSNLELLKIIRSEDIDADAMSPGEILLLLEAGFEPENILYIGNNVSVEEMLFAVERNIDVSVDSLSQLDSLGRAAKGARVSLRINPGLGVGHNEKVVTGGTKTKFGIQPSFIKHALALVNQHGLQLVGMNQHIGSLFLEPAVYLESASKLLEIASSIPTPLEYIDFGGGFGVPYEDSQSRLDLGELGERLGQMINKFLIGYSNKDVYFKVESGRYISAECGFLLGEVHAVKSNFGIKYVGTDVGFNVLMRPVLYDSYHKLEVITDRKSDSSEKITVVGNICETGDIIAKDRLLPECKERDIICIHNTGAYGFAMSSNYNCRLRPSEVLIDLEGKDSLVRRRDTYEDLFRNFRL